jgi:enoyl-CoA hydratase
MTQPATTTFETVLYTKNGAIAQITLNRPKVLNALNRQTIADLRTACELAQEDSDLLGPILTGAGEKAFAAGADIYELSQLTVVEAQQNTRTATSCSISSRT